MFSRLFERLGWVDKPIPDAVLHKHENVAYLRLTNFGTGILEVSDLNFQLPPDTPYYQCRKVVSEKDLQSFKGNEILLGVCTPTNRNHIFKSWQAELEYDMWSKEIALKLKHKGKQEELHFR